MSNSLGIRHYSFVIDGHRDCPPLCAVMNAVQLAVSYVSTRDFTPGMMFAAFS